MLEPSYTYTAAGTYTVSLTVTTSSGNTYSASKPISVLTGTIYEVKAAEEIVLPTEKLHLYAEITRGHFDHYAWIYEDSVLVEGDVPGFSRAGLWGE